MFLLLNQLEIRMFCKKIELKILKFDRMAYILSKTYFRDFFKKFDFLAIFEKFLISFFDFG